MNTTAVSLDQELQPVQEKEHRLYVASQWQLMWWRFRKHRLALFSALLLLVFYIIALVPEFFATADPYKSNSKYSLIPPQKIHWFDEGRFSPHIYALEGRRDPATF